MLNVVFHGNIFNNAGVQYAGDVVNYQLFFYKVGAGSSPSAWSNVRQSILGQYNINLGDGDILQQTGIITAGDHVVILCWTPNTSVRTDTNLIEWSLTDFTIGSSSPNQVYLRDIQTRPAQIPNCVSNSVFADPSLTINDLGSNDVHSWLFAGNTMEHRPTLYGENMFSGMNVIDYIRIDWDDTVVQTGLVPGGSYNHNYLANGSYTAEFRAYNVGGEYCVDTYPVTVTAGPGLPLTCDFDQIKSGCGYRYTASVSGGVPPYFYKWEVYEGTILLAELETSDNTFYYNWPRVGTFDVNLSVYDDRSPSGICLETKTYPVTECPIEIRTIIQPGGGTIPQGNHPGGVPYMHYADRYKEITDEFDKLEQRVRAQVTAELVGEFIQTEQMNYTRAVERKDFAKVSVEDIEAELLGEIINTKHIDYQENKSSATISVICLNENPEIIVNNTEVTAEQIPDVAAKIVNRPIVENLEASNPKSEDIQDVCIESKVREIEKEKGNVYIDLLEVVR